jgi:hypothetical protein
MDGAYPWTTPTFVMILASLILPATEMQAQNSRQVASTRPDRPSVLVLAMPGSEEPEVTLRLGMMHGPRATCLARWRPDRWTQRKREVCRIHYIEAKLQLSFALLANELSAPVFMLTH